MPPKKLWIALSLAILLAVFTTSAVAAQSLQEMTYQAEIIVVGTVGAPVNVRQATTEPGTPWYTDWGFQVEKYIAKPGLSDQLVISTPGAEGKPAGSSDYQLDQWGQRVLVLLTYRNGSIVPMDSLGVIALKGDQVVDSRLTAEDKGFIQDFLAKAKVMVPGEQNNDTATNQPAEPVKEPVKEPAAKAPAKEEPKTEPAVVEKEVKTEFTQENAPKLKQPGKNMVVYLVTAIVILFIITIPILKLMQPKKYEHPWDKYLY